MKFKLHPMWWGLGAALVGIAWETRSLSPALIIGGIVVFLSTLVQRITQDF